MKTQETQFSYLSDADFAITFYMQSYLTSLSIYPSINKLILSAWDIFRHHIAAYNNQQTLK